MIKKKKEWTFRRCVLGTMGLAKTNHHLSYHYKGGFGYLWLPIWFKDKIVSIWNTIACWRYGHEAVGEIPGEDFIDECMHCLTKLEEEDKVDYLIKKGQS